MKTLLFIGAFILICIFYDQIHNFVSNSIPDQASVTKWLADHTPKHN